ncbi:hypothetical protein ACTWQB_13890 [Piscibacillus sp. B03]
MSKSTTCAVTLEFYQDKHRSGLSDYHLSDEQNRYASKALDALEQC